MKKYRFILQKYSGIASRHTCPQCGGKHEFSLYIDTLTNEIVHPTVGKCNREDKCGYHYTPSEYFSDNSLALVKVHTFTRPSERELVNFSKPSMIHTLDMKWCERSLGYKSNFIYWLSQYFDSRVIMSLVDEYKIGYTKDSRVIFWQIDKQGKLRTGKVMQYNAKNGQRCKGIGSCNWIHAMLKKRGDLPSNFELKQCLFGEHLIDKYPDKTIAVTESAKNACIGYCVFPEYVWVSVDAMSGLSESRCQALAGRRVIFFPDLGKGHKMWSEKIPELAAKIGFKYTISELLERTATDEQRASGCDIADYIMSKIWQGVKPSLIADRLYEEDQVIFDSLLNKNQRLANLTEVLDLEFSRSKRLPKLK